MSRIPRTLFDVVLVVFTVALAVAVLGAAGGDAAPGSGEGSGDALLDALSRAMPHSGVKHPVTAVLLNFRGYDTLLEMLVLLLAMLGVRSLGELPVHTQSDSPNPVLTELLQLLSPVLVLVSVYLLWRGSSGPGGAFQAGAVLCAAGVLWLLTEDSAKRWPSRLPLRPLLALGLGTFASIGMWLATTEGAFLAYPDDKAGTLIFTVEVLATLSIAATLLVLFTGAPISEE